ncbi:polysaccharide deacetylase family protein [Neobacillus sp. PS3-40]|uniref:polysaccharide deacetylase family protein n=1 Tax=Neobacillus sp. PS3-40 TaxID=3070679 RepID=UPI0027E0AE79|nr:polysaccharide deacetylase family protein [Neobacillus sp. PS3-40]WML43470.1 polysaccharide deacetylase family protein [Neobacillus sp. PS3-40]
MIFVATIIIFLVLFLLYTVIPYILSSWAGFGVYRKGIRTRQIAFTFDDGPSPTYTNELLDLLNQHQIKASFFVVGSKAENYPEIIQRMYREGHLIGIHNYVHQSNWFMSPWKVKQGLEKSVQVIENIIGVKPTFYRPPWGVLNLFDFFIHKKYRIILWSLMVGDWRSKGGSKKIESRLLERVKPGDIVLLHDCGDTWGANEDAPQFTIEALKRVILELSKQGYTYSRVDEMIQ